MYKKEHKKCPGPLDLEGIVSGKRGFVIHFILNERLKNVGIQTMGNL